MKLRVLMTLTLCALLSGTCVADGYRDVPRTMLADNDGKKKDEKKESKKDRKEREKQEKREAERKRNAQLFNAGRDVVFGTLGGPMTAETEHAIGGTMAVKSFTEKGRRDANESLQGYVNKVGLSLVRKSSRAGQPFSFAVVDDAEIASWAAPGGYVFITTGLLGRIVDESELAGILAHEIAHVTQEHMLTMMKREQVISGLMSGAQGLAGKDDLTQYSKAADVGSDLIFNRGLDRNMEYEADLVGVDLAARTGYDPAGLVRVLNRIKDDKGPLNKMFSTHPDYNDRIARINAKLAAELSGVEGAQGKERFQKMVAAKAQPST
ncbi:M48 family metallopeptidase [Candidatus Sumerlaeota bacterium]|nr:M48 family metallopeptidase [Candidatus Sumerlaeota bacterium]